MKLLKYVFVLLGFAQTIPVIGQGTAYLITGTVVDGKRRPMANAGVCLEPVHYRATTVDRYIECVKTDAAGHFKLTKDNNPTTQSDHFLFVYSGTSRSGLPTIEPPFEWVRRYDKAFDGKLVRFGSSPNVDLGRLRVQFWFAMVEVDFSKMKEKTGEVDWENLYLRIKNKRGTRVYESSLSHDDIYVESYIKKDKLQILVPEGRWKLEGVWNGKVRGVSGYFTAKRSTISTPVLLYSTHKRGN
jgi:hypothetical protein